MTTGVGGFSSFCKCTRYSTLRLQSRVSLTHCFLLVSKKFFQDFHSNVKGIYTHGNPKKAHVHGVPRPLFAKNIHIKSRPNCNQSSMRLMLYMQ